MESVLKGTEGVISGQASFIKGVAVVGYDPARTSPEELVTAINTMTSYRASLGSAQIETLPSGPCNGCLWE